MARPHTLDVSLFLPRAAREVFPFFADAANLEAITPPWLNFEIASALPISMREGAIIEYRLRLRGIGIAWKTRIDAYDPPRMFIDVQTAGPYRLWRHTHLFHEIGPLGDRPAGTLVRDRVEYLLPRLPPGVYGAVHRLLVRPELERIFRHRQARIIELMSVPAESGDARAGAGPASLVSPSAR